MNVTEQQVAPPGIARTTNAAAVPADRPPAPGLPQRSVLAHMRDYALVAVLLAELVLWTVLSPDFLSEQNLINIARAASAIGVMAVGMTFVILTAGIDLSVGSLVSLSGILAAAALGRIDNVLIGVAVALGMGLLSGLFSGALVAWLRVPPFIATLGLLNVWAACAELWNNGGPVSVPNAAIIQFGSGYVGPIPIPVIVLAVTFIAGYWLLAQTQFGRHVYAIGGNRRAARMSGIRVERVLLGVYVLSGLLAGLAALMYDGRLATASPLTGTGLELQVIAAVIVGGCSLFGGRGSLRDTFLGVLILAVLQNGLTLVGVSGYWQTFATGIALLVAVVLSGDAQIKQRLLRREVTD
jgi:ribose/xylose/arabinose/galactoside ABC-type transport system permease subunit